MQQRIIDFVQALRMIDDTVFRFREPFDIDNPGADGVELANAMVNHPTQMAQFFKATSELLLELNNGTHIALLPTNPAVIAEYLNCIVKLNRENVPGDWVDEESRSEWYEATDFIRDLAELLVEKAQERTIDLIHAEPATVKAEYDFRTVAPEDKVFDFREDR